MDQLDAVTLLYLLKNPSELANATNLLEYAHIFQPTKDQLSDLLREEKSKKLADEIESGTFGF